MPPAFAEELAAFRARTDGPAVRAVITGLVLERAQQALGIVHIKADTLKWTPG